MSDHGYMSERYHTGGGLSDRYHTSPDISQSEYLPETSITVEFTGVYDAVDDRVVTMRQVATGRSVDEAWANLCATYAREADEMTYDDYRGV